MKLLRIILLALLTAAMAAADTVKLGKHIYYNEDGKINIAVDAGVAVRNLDESYVMFMLYMGADEKERATITPEDIVMIYNDEVYKMPSLSELRENYQGDNRDMSLYSTLNKTPLAFSDIRYYRFPVFEDFFPARKQATIPVSEGAMTDYVGFITRAYFKNPGFKSGDVILIRVVDKKNDDVWGAVAVELIEE